MKSIFHNYKSSKIEVFLLFLFFIILFWAIISQIRSTGWSLWFEANELDHIGSFMGGLFALISIFYLIKNLAEQRLITAIQSFESNYLEIVKFCRQQIEHACIPNPDSLKKDEQQIRSREIFNLFFFQIERTMEYIEKFMEDKQFNDLFIDQNEYSRQSQIWGNKLKDRTFSSIAYVITYVGVRKINIRLLKNKYLSTYNPIYIDEILEHFRMRLAKYASKELQNQEMNRLHQLEILNCDDKEYYGFQDEIGNYFRLLFQAVNYVDNQQILDYQEKYNYIKILRGQMSNMEEIILFYNSLCDLGLAWEYEEPKKDLITKYNLIKNIPASLTKISIEKFYPNVYYEYMNVKPAGRKEYKN